MIKPRNLRSEIRSFMLAFESHKEMFGLIYFRIMCDILLGVLTEE